MVLNHCLPSLRHMRDKTLVHWLCRCQLRIQRTEYWQTNLYQPSRWRTQCKQSSQLKSSIHCCICRMQMQGSSQDLLRLQHTVYRTSALQLSTRRQSKHYTQSTHWSPSQQCQQHSQCMMSRPVQHTDRWSSRHTMWMGRCQCLQCLLHSLCMQPYPHLSSASPHYKHCM